MHIEREPIFHLLIYFFTTAICTDVKEFFIDEGKNFTLNCPLNYSDVIWVRDGRADQQISRSTVLNNGSLFLKNTDETDGGLYECFRGNVVTNEKKSVRINIRTPPPALVNVEIRPSTIIAVIVWELNGTGGYPISNFTAQYRLAYTDNKWIPIPPNHITPNSHQIEVYGLKPNTTYEFRIWATNQLGRGEKTLVVATTKGAFSEEELAQQLLAGADKFDTRIWAVAVGVVMGTLVLLSLGTCILIYHECKQPNTVSDDHEVIELVPNIILNPGFENQNQINQNNENLNQNMYPDENSNSENPIRLNNNTVVQPRQINI